jgi:hypothetical protein
MDGPTCIFWADLTPFSLLRPTGSTEIAMDTSELSACAWMPLEEYLGTVSHKR